MFLLIRILKSIAIIPYHYSACFLNSIGLYSAGHPADTNHRSVCQLNRKVWYSHTVSLQSLVMPKLSMHHWLASSGKAKYPCHRRLSVPLVKAPSTWSIIFLGITPISSFPSLWYSKCQHRLCTTWLLRLVGKNNRTNLLSLTTSYRYLVCWLVD